MRSGWTPPLEASAPIVNLINSTLNTTTSTNSTGAMHLYQSSVTSIGPVFGLDHSTLNVQYGPLLRLTGGSNLTVNGDFSYLTNGSKIWVQNGPMVLVSGESSTGKESSLQITGALVNFGAGNNTVIINNPAVTPNDYPGGIPVFKNGQSSKGVVSNVQVGATPIVGGGIQVGGTTPPPNTVHVQSGAAIQATGGGQVKINLP